MERLHEIKNQLINRVINDIHNRSVERINVDEMCKIIDMIHHVAETEYYTAVAHAMGGDQSNLGIPYGTVSQGGHWNSVYSSLTDPIRQKMQNATPEERERLRSELMSMVSSM